jgi:hypothetical protein
LSLDIIAAIKSGRMRLVGCGRHGEKINTHRVFVGKPEEERMRERRILKWEDDIRMDLEETKWEDVDWTDVPRNCGKWQDVVNIEIKLQSP